ncbi:MAG: hypothetical protein HY297_02125 [Thaumarchaeota archaeon]|nr:hypothetical protein [Nitrososphaerota archaeon]
MTQPGGWSKGRLLVVVTLGGAVAFGAALGYLVWSNNSFPAETRPFDDYAKVVSATFNGTEYSFKLRWVSSGYLPLYAQLRSEASEAANTPVCELRLDAVADGQTVYLPFGISKPTSALTNVDLLVAVRAVSGGTEFTIVHRVAEAMAQQGDVVPSDVVCTQGGTRS